MVLTLVDLKPTWVGRDYLSFLCSVSLLLQPEFRLALNQASAENALVHSCFEEYPHLK